MDIKYVGGNFVKDVVIQQIFSEFREDILAKEIEFNEKAEAQAVLDYTEFLQMLDGAEDVEDLDKKFTRETIKEIISDELNHQSKLKMLYKTLSGIKENKS